MKRTLLALAALLASDGKTPSDTGPGPVMGPFDETARTYTRTIEGTGDADKIKSTDTGELIDGKGGADILYGYAGDDGLYGGDGDDRLFGGDGADYLEGGNGNDMLGGDAGSDVLLRYKVRLVRNFGKSEESTTGENA